MRLARHRAQTFRGAGLLLALAMGCSAPPAPATSPPPFHRDPVDLSQEWELTSPDEVGVDAAALARALTVASAISGLESAAVVRRGRLIAEWYRDPGTPDAVRAVRSVTKSVMSLLVGIAIERGVLEGTSEHLASVFRPPLPALSGTQDEITLEHLLTMSSGFEWNEAGNVAGYNDWVLAPDQIAYLLAQPITSAPGTRWNYNSAAVHLLSAALEVSSDGGTEAFADEVLLGPLGIHQRAWEHDNRGIPNGGAGLSLRTRDLAKLGELVLQRGRSGTAQIVPAEWVDASITPSWAAVGGLPATGTLDYGRLWWLGQLDGNALTLGWGYGGQLVAVLPALDLVVVTTARWQGLGAGAPAQTDAIAGWIAGVLRAVQAR